MVHVNQLLSEDPEVQLCTKMYQTVAEEFLHLLVIFCAAFHFFSLQRKSYKTVQISNFTALPWVSEQQSDGMRGGVDFGVHPYREHMMICILR